MKIMRQSQRFLGQCGAVVTLRIAGSGKKLRYVYGSVQIFEGPAFKTIATTIPVRGRVPSGHERLGGSGDSQWLSNGMWNRCALISLTHSKSTTSWKLLAKKTHGAEGTTRTLQDSPNGRRKYFSREGRVESKKAAHLGKWSGIDASITYNIGGKQEITEYFISRIMFILIPFNLIHVV